ncbi:MAG: M20/M25/M40 family metallo-hydrolase [Syntrophomonadaceae bacterium]|nr:M20/M25/M40 family metallo-hydrolase [Syntrophomonadaceae bacterium]
MIINESRVVNLFLRLAEIASPSRREGALRDYLRTSLEKRGLRVTEDQAGAMIEGDSGNLLVEIPGTVAGPALLFSAHMDTVQPGVGVKARVGADGIIRSAGDTILGGDDKIGLAALLEAYDVLKEEKIPHPPIEFLFTVCEEQGLLGAKNFDFRRSKAKMGYVLDAGDDPGAIVLCSPALNAFEYKVYGKAAHAGINPETGLNAVKIAAAAIAKMPDGRIDHETTCSIGLISGGTARNIVPEKCVVIGEARSISGVKLAELTERLIRTFTEEVEKMGAAAETKVEQLYPEISLEPNEPAVQLAVHAVNHLGLTPKLISTGGGSDASILNAAGIPCVNLGVGMKDVHTCGEFFSVASLKEITEIVLAIIKMSAIA